MNEVVLIVNIVFLVILPVDPGDGGSIFLQNVGKRLPNYMVQYPRR
jgi:hypothetical protein